MNILLDVNSGSVHLLDEAAAEFVRAIESCQGDVIAAAESMKSYDQEELAAIIDDLGCIYAEGLIFSDFDEILPDFAPAQVKAMCLNVAHACNMRCAYCFAGQGSFGLKPSLMDIPTARQALDFLIDASGDRRFLEVDFFGGEPLLARDVIFDLVAYGRQREIESGKTINFTLTTNALLLDEQMISFVVDNGLAVILSLDGRPQINDLHRPMPDGAGSYSRVMPRIKAMIEAGPVSHYVRGTFSRKNLDFARDLEWLIQEGFECISLEPAVGEDKECCIQPEDLPQVLKEYERMTEVLAQARRSGKPVHFFHYNLDLQQGPCLGKRLSGCGAGLEYVAVTPEGEIYPCHRFIGMDDFRMGHVSNGLSGESIRGLFASSQLAAKDECRACWARYFCGGGCHASAFFTNKDLTSPDMTSCEMHRKRIEGAIYLDILERSSQ